MKHKLLLALYLALLPVWAHHPFSETYDSSKPVTIAGEVKEFQWADPHTVLRMEGEAPNTGEWRLEGASSGTLGRQGWNANTVKAGDRVTVHAYRSKDGSQSGSARSIVLPGGSEMSMSDPQEDGGPAPQLTSQTSPGPAGRDILAQNQPEGELPRTASPVWKLAWIGVLAGWVALVMARRRRSAA